jgi:hypothetical protein
MNIIRKGRASRPFRHTVAYRISDFKTIEKRPDIEQHFADGIDIEDQWIRWKRRQRCINGLAKRLFLGLELGFLKTKSYL